MTILFELTIIFLFSFLSALIFKLLKQPLIVSYIFIGIVLSYFLTPTEIKSLIHTFSDIGIIFLLFLVGLELKLKTLREIGRQAIIIGSLQEILTILVGFFVAKILGFSDLAAFYLGSAFSFSSTIIMVKLISDKGDMEKLYGKLAVGFLLVQDLITILMLLFIPFWSKELSTNIYQVIFGAIALVLIPTLSIKILPRLENILAKSHEVLFLFSLAFGFGLATLFKYLNIGLEAGALIAGVSLSTLSVTPEIVSRLKPLRDFFLIAFFVVLGLTITTNFQISNFFLNSLIFSLFILIGNPLIMFVMLKLLNYSNKTSFLLGLTSAQISEFSFILINLGIKLGHISQDLLPLTALTGIVTIFLSTYMFTYADSIYKLIEKPLKFLEKKQRKEEQGEEKPSYDVILFGCDRTGYGFLEVFKKLNINFLIVDYDFEKVKNLKKEGFNIIYGDAAEVDFLEELNLKETKLIVSTVPDYETNLLILEFYRSLNPNGIFISTARRFDDAFDLYKNGADYVIIPHFLGGEYASLLFEKHQFNKEEYQKIKEKHLQHLQKRKELGHKI
jgi:Kef-type K+ transport system membrane component KefB